MAKQMKKTEPTSRGRVSKVKKKVVNTGIVYVKSTYNNTHVTICEEENGEVIAVASSGMIPGYKNCKKKTAYPAMLAANKAIEKAIEVSNLKQVRILANGYGLGRDAVVRAVAASSLHLIHIADNTPIPHNGCRPSKRRRN